MIWWVRHGESTWNAAGRHQGSNRLPPLTARGQRQAEEAGRLLADRGVEELYTSPALRALQTAAVIGGECGVVVTVEPALIECDRDEAGETAADRLREFLQRHAGTERVVVAVSHGETIRAAAQLLGAQSIEVPPNGAVLGLDRAHVAHETVRPGPAWTTK